MDLHKFDFDFIATTIANRLANLKKYINFKMAIRYQSPYLNSFALNLIDQDSLYN